MNAHTTPTRHDGWTGERQRAFLEAVAVGASVEEACAHVGMSVSSAYALRRRAAGAAFALGWQAACLLARDRIADALTARAIDGQVDTYTRADGSTVTRHRFDNRLASTMLARLDRLADDPAATRSHDAARLIATGWDAWLAGMAADDSPAAVGVFLHRRGLGAGQGDAPADERDLAPLLALAGADRWLRGGADIARDVDVTDLDPAARAGWSADQWARAEAAGLLRFAMPAHLAADAADDDDAPTPPLPPLVGKWPDQGSRIWPDDPDGVLVTDFPPPPGVEVFASADWGHPDYYRRLTQEEEDLVDAYERAERIACGDLVEIGAAQRERAAWFDAVRADIAAMLAGTTFADEGFSAAIPTDERPCHGDAHARSEDDDCRQDEAGTVRREDGRSRCRDQARGQTDDRAQGGGDRRDRQTAACRPGREPRDGER